MPGDALPQWALLSLRCWDHSSSPGTEAACSQALWCEPRYRLTSDLPPPATTGISSSTLNFQHAYVISSCNMGLVFSGDPLSLGAMTNSSTDLGANFLGGVTHCQPWDAGYGVLHQVRGQRRLSLRLWYKLSALPNFYISRKLWGNSVSNEVSDKTPWASGLHIPISVCRTSSDKWNCFLVCHWVSSENQREWVHQYGMPGHHFSIASFILSLPFDVTNVTHSKSHWVCLIPAIVPSQELTWLVCNLSVYCLCGTLSLV